MKKIDGITVIALVVTIIVLLILAGVTIATLTGNSGILTQAGKAKETTEIGEEKEIIGLSIIQATNNNRTIDEDELQKALNENSKEGNKASVIASDIETFTIKFESNRYYEVNKNGNIEYIDNVTGEKTLTVQCVNSKNELLGEYEYLVLTDRYSKLPPNIDKYESAEEKLEGEMTEDKTIQAIYYLICNDDTTLVFTGLDSNGDITKNESEIVSYMIGDGSSITGNALKEKEISAVLNIPEKHKGKPVEKIGGYAFYNAQNLIKLRIGDSIKIIDPFFAFAYTNITEVTIGKNVSSIGQYSFHCCKKLNKVIFKNSMEEYGNIFGEANNWKYIELSGDNSYYMVADNILYSSDGKSLILVPTGKQENFNVPESVEKIEGNAFVTCGIKKVIIRNNVKKILPYFAFGHNLEEVVIGENLETISGYAFYNSKNLSTVIIESLKISKQLTGKGTCGNLIDYAETIYIKTNITEIGNYITDNFKIVESEKEGYFKYTKK